jgi:hypothetical protein
LEAKPGVIGDDGSGGNIGTPPGPAQWGSGELESGLR